MIFTFENFINEKLNAKTEKDAWRGMRLVTDNVKNIYSYIYTFASTLVSRGEKDNKHLPEKLLKDNYYKEEIKHIIALMLDYENQNANNGKGGDLAEFMQLSEDEQMKMIADRVADEVEEY